MAEMTRAEVYVALDTERAYQNAMIADPMRPDMVPQLSVGETLLAMEHALVEARREWYSGNGFHQPAMEFVRKIGGLAVQAGENYGMPSREGFE